MKSAPAQTIVLALLGASRGRALPAKVLVGGAAILGVTGNATRLALSRLLSKGELVSTERGRYQLSTLRRSANAHVRAFKTGFAQRTTWKGGFLAVLTGDLPRTNATAIARRERALNLSGFRIFRHGVWVRPDNLAGGRVVVDAHLRRLGLDADADTVTLHLDPEQARLVERAWAIDDDAAKALELTRRVQAFLVKTHRTRQAEAAESFWLGDEVLRFLARDPLLPDTMADPDPRRRLADAMAALDERGFATWSALLEELEHD